MATGVFRRDSGNAALVTIEAACNVLRHYGASATTVAALQRLQGAKRISPAELSSLASPSAHHSAENGKATLEEPSGNDESDDEVSMISHSSSGSPAAGASAQPTSSVPAVKQKQVPVSKSGDRSPPPETSDDEDAPEDQSPAAGRAAASTQPSSTAAKSKRLPQVQRSSQVQSCSSHTEVSQRCPQRDFKSWRTLCAYSLLLQHFPKHLPATRDQVSRLYLP